MIGKGTARQALTQIAKLVSVGKQACDQSKITRGLARAGW